MSITVRDLIRRSLRKLALVAQGREPTAAQASDALDVLQSLYRELAAQGVFGRLHDVLVTGSTYTPRENERVVCNSDVGVTVTFPDTITASLLNSLPDYGFGESDYGRGQRCETLPRPPRDGSIIWLTDIPGSFDKGYIYEGSKARWTPIDDLTLDSVAPLSGRYANGLAAILAVKMATEYNVTPPPSVMAEANLGRHMLSQKLDRSRRAVVAEYF